MLTHLCKYDGIFFAYFILYYKKADPFVIQELLRMNFNSVPPSAIMRSYIPLILQRTTHYMNSPKTGCPAAAEDHSYADGCFTGNYIVQYAADTDAVCIKFVYDVT